MNGGAIFSPCRTWRYRLWRQWVPGGRLAAFIGLNPSTADEEQDDPTVRKCIGFARRWGFGSMVMLNIFGFRSTDPSGLLVVPDPVGPDNESHLIHAARFADRVVAAWGSFSKPLMRAQARRVASLLAEARVPLLCLRESKGGNPWHPLYVPYAAVPKPWPPSLETT